MIVVDCCQVIAVFFLFCYILCFAGPEPEPGKNCLFVLKLCGFLRSYGRVHSILCHFQSYGLSLVGCATQLSVHQFLLRFLCVLQLNHVKNSICSSEFIPEGFCWGDVSNDDTYSLCFAKPEPKRKNSA